jgi:hypothetical protein
MVVSRGSFQIQEWIPVLALKQVPVLILALMKIPDP